MLPSFQMFLSYKEQDGDAVDAAKDELLSFANDYLRLKPCQTPEGTGCFSVFLARDRQSIDDGTPWRDEIAARLRACDVFLLLFTTPNTDWAWCLYEAGLFAGGQVKADQPPGAGPPVNTGQPADLDRRLLCLHTDRGPRPGPLSHLQATAATKSGIREFLTRQVVGRIGFAPGMPDEKYRERVEAVVDKFAAIFSPYERLNDLSLSEPRSLLPRISIRAALNDVADVSRLFDNATVRFYADANAIFDLPANAIVRFPLFAAKLAKKEAWVRTLRDAVRTIMSGPSIVPPSQVVIDVIQPDGGRRIYRPVMTDAIPSANVVEFHICFVELLDDPSAYQQDLDRCFKLLRIVHSFRMSVVEPLKGLSDDASWSAVNRAELAQNISNILARYAHFDLDRGPDPISKMEPDERDKLRALRPLFSGAAKDILEYAENGKSPTRGLAAAAHDLHVANMAWLDGVARFYGSQVAKLSKETEITPIAPTTPVRIAFVRNGDATYTREVQRGFTERTDALLNGSRYVAVYEEADGVAEASRDAENQAVFDDLLTWFGGGNAPDYLVTIGTQVSQFAKRHYLGRLPIIFVAVTDPIRNDLVSHFEPDVTRGDICGVTFGVSTIARLSFIADAFPGMRLGFIYNPDFLQDVAVRDQVLALAPTMSPPMAIVPIGVREPKLSDEQLASADLFFGWDYLNREFPQFADRYDKPFVGLTVSDGMRSAIAAVGNVDDKHLGAVAAEKILVPNLLTGVPLHAIPIQSPEAPLFTFNKAVADRFRIGLAAKVERRVQILIDPKRAKMSTATVGCAEDAGHRD
jgi:hypothetical protein